MRTLKRTPLRTAHARAGRAAGAGFCLLFLLAACGKPAPQLDADAVALNNRGVALMGRFEYAQAHAAFSELTTRAPDWLPGQVNLAIATLNRQEEGDVEAAMALANGVLQRDPQAARAHYVAGLLNLYVGNVAPAETHFRAVIAADPADGHAHYYLGQALQQREAFDEALAAFEAARSRDPYLRSAYYAMATSLRRLGKADEAAGVLRDYQRFENNPRAHLAEFKYTRMGPKAEAAAYTEAAATAATPAAPAGDVFAAPARLDGIVLRGDARAAPSLTTVDVNADGVQDLFATAPMAASAAAAGGNTVLLGEPGGGFAPAPHPLAAIDGVQAVAWGDFDNDGITDAFFCRAGGNQLWRQAPAGTWSDVTASTGIGGGACSDVAMVDADHDGDLDLFVAGSAGSELLNNNRDGTFQALSGQQPLLNAGKPVRQVLAADLDSDRDTDLVLVGVQPPHQVLLNDRLWSYRRDDAFAALEAADLRAVVAGDVDADGHSELYAVVGSGELQRWQRDAEGRFASTSIGTVLPPGATPAGAVPTSNLALHDVDGDGRPDLIVASPEAVRVNDPGTGKVHHEGAGAVAVVTLPVGDAMRRGPSLATLVPAAGGGFAVDVLAPGPGRFDFVALDLSGREDGSGSMRSNASGIGTRVQLRIGASWTVTDTFAADAAPGQSAGPLLLGLGGGERADFVALDWSDGVYQTELDIAAGERRRIVETQRQLASCPVVFAWDGSRYAFVSDVLGVGGLGFLAEPGVYAPPRPFEYYLLDGSRLAAKDGRYHVKLTEPMEEAAYLDSARLHVHDLPAGWSMTLDERMGISGPEVTGRPIYYRSERAPSQVLANGTDATTQARSADGDAVPVPAIDERFIGLLAQPHEVTLEFASALDAEAQGQPVLLAEGWIEYPYSQTVFAAWQAGLRYEAVSLEARSAGGDWQPLLAEFGYPAGMPRQMALPLPSLPAGTVALRLRTNMEIYWDRLRVVYEEALPAAAQVQTLVPAESRVAKVGFAERRNLAQRRPDYDYARRSAFWDTKYQDGFYTDLGPSTELTAAVDDAFAIIGPGEEVHVEFAAPADARPGGNRYFVLEFRGYAKDMDLYTEHAETVGPLPETPALAADSRSQGRELDARFNTRYQGGR